jgi:uroporphyrin-III C-methyltransferase
LKIKKRGVDWPVLEQHSALTLALYMGRAAAPEIARRLIEHGLAGDTPVMVAANVSLAGEQLVTTRLDLLPLAAKGVGDGPALLLIGSVVAGAGQAGLQKAAAATRPVTTNGGML